MAFGETINSIIEKQNIDVEVAAKHVEHLVSSDAEASPSPVTIHTDSSGRATFNPVANAGALP